MAENGPVWTAESLKKFFENTNAPEMSRATYLPSLASKGLIADLLPYVAKMSIPKGAMRELCKKHGCSDRTMRRQFTGLKVQYKAKETNQTESLLEEVCLEAAKITRASKESSSSISSDDDNDDVDIDSDETFVEYMACYQRKKVVTLSDEKRKEFVHDCLFVQEENKLPKGSMDVLQKK